MFSFFIWSSIVESGINKALNLFFREVENVIKQNLYRHRRQPGHRKSDSAMPIARTEPSFMQLLLKTDNEPYPLHESLSLLLTTSGSTGNPKLVRHKYGNLEANAANVAKVFS